MTPPEEGFHSASPTQHDGTRVHFTDYLNPYFSVCDYLWGEKKSASESGCFCKLNNLILGRKI